MDISHSVTNTEIIEHDEQKRPLRSSGQPQEGANVVVLKSVDKEPSTLFILASIVRLLVLKYCTFPPKRNLSSLAEFWNSVGHLFTCPRTGIWCANDFESHSFCSSGPPGSGVPVT